MITSRLDTATSCLPSVDFSGLPLYVVNRSQLPFTSFTSDVHSSTTRRRRKCPHTHRRTVLLRTKFELLQKFKHVLSTLARSLHTSVHTDSSLNCVCTSVRSLNGQTVAVSPRCLAQTVDHSAVSLRVLIALNLLPLRTPGSYVTRVMFHVDGCRLQSGRHTSNIKSTPQS